jgi:hypothetical protein
VTADWRYPDSTLHGETWERRKELAGRLEGQLRAFIQLPFRSLDEISLRERLLELRQGAPQSEALFPPWRLRLGWHELVELVLYGLR